MGALPEQMTKMVSRINEKNPYLLAGLLAGGISVAYYFLFLQNKINEINTVQTEISGLQQSGTSTKSDIDRLAQYETELKSLNEKGEKLKVMIKTKEEVPVILENVSKMADRNGVTIEQIMPDTDKGKVVLKNSEGKYIAVPIVIGARSGYHNFGRFMNQLETEGMLTIPDFAIMTNDKDNDHHLIKLILHVTIFEKAENATDKTGS
jgi:Tfp pilus assembly protein PilO